MKKIITVFIFFILCISFIASDRRDNPPGSSPNNGNINPFITSQLKMQVNQISTWYRNNGSYNRDPASGNSGFEWPKGTRKTARYASGLWLGGKIQGQIRVAVAEYDYEYNGGQMNFATHQPYGKDDAAYKLYNIYPNRTNDPDYINWPFNQGAPADPTTGLPLILGSQTIYYVYTDGYPESHGVRAGSTLPLGAEIQQTNWAYNFNGPLGSMIFQRFKIVNKSAYDWDSAFVSLWTDDDLGGSAGQDLVGCDTSLSLGYTYKGAGNDPQYGTNCPAVGFDFFQGPLIDSPGDTAVIPVVETHQIIRIPNKKVLGMTSFNKYRNSHPIFGDPRNSIETYNYMKGLTRSGDEWIDPITNQPTKFVNPGDPELGTGWLDTEPDDRRFMMTTGPFTMRTGDTQTVVTVQLIARGTSHNNSVTQLKTADKLAQKIYDLAFQAPEAFPAPGVTAFAPGDGKIYLTWDGSPENKTVENKLSNNKYIFQGYQVYGVKAGTNGENAEDRKLMATFDLIDSLDVIKDTIVDQYGIPVYVPIVEGSNSGIQRYYIFDKDPITGNLFINGSPYRFVVISYGYDWKAGNYNGTPRVNFSSYSNSVITVIPQNLTQGTQLSSLKLSDTVDVSFAKRSIAAKPIVFIPLNLINASYQLTYQPLNQNTVNGFSTLTWSLTRNNVPIVTKYPDISGKADTALIIDGMMMLVTTVPDSGVVRDKSDPLSAGLTKANYGWDYNPPQNLWVKGPDTNQIKKIPVAALFLGRQFQSKYMGLSHPTIANYRQVKSKVAANIYYQFDSLIYHCNGLRKVKLVFGTNQLAYRYSPATPFSTDSNLTNTPYRDYVNVPFSVYMVENLDSSQGAPRQLNCAFIDADDNGIWDPDNSLMGKFQILYILNSSYSSTPDPFYTSKNPGFSSGFSAMDIMYVWVPRVNTSGPTTYQNGDELIIYPYVITTTYFVPGYSISYPFSTEGSIVGDPSLASNRNDMDKINVFPNPYFGGHRLEASNFDRFVYFSNLPNQCTIYIYTLNGELIRTIARNNTDPNNSLERWSLQNQDNVSVASGMYIVYIDAPGIGTKILKLAIFTPEERISTF